MGIESKDFVNFYEVRDRQTRSGLAKNRNAINISKIVLRNIVILYIKM